MKTRVTLFSPPTMDVKIEIRRIEGSSVKLQVVPDGTVIAYAPPHYDIEPFIKHKRAWIEKKLREIENISQNYGNFDHLLLLNGVYYSLTQGRSCHVDEQTTTITYDTPIHLTEFLILQLRCELEEKVSHYSELIGKGHVKVSIKTQRSKWGSCSGRGNLNFNLVTLALRPHVREYIVVHEVIHLIERNHSFTFWEKIEKFCPDYRKSEDELKTYSILIERNSIWKVLQSLRKHV